MRHVSAAAFFQPPRSPFRAQNELFTDIAFREPLGRPVREETKDSEQFILFHLVA
jgi:hypothetical protein